MVCNDGVAIDGRHKVGTPSQNLRFKRNGALRGLAVLFAPSSRGGSRFQTMGGTATATQHGMHLKMQVFGLRPLSGSEPTNVNFPPHLLHKGASV